MAAYGKVYKARHKSQMKYNLGINNEGIPDCFTEEANLLKDLSNSFYVFRVLHGQHMIEEGKSRVFIVCEHLDKDLRNFIHSQPLHPSLVQSFMYQLCMGVAHCHTLDVLHRDLKPENLIVDTKRGILKVADFHLKMSFIPLSEINSPQVLYVIERQSYY
ncbi:hypothetical protein QJS10_CPB20g00024 [Acorus calamus]|uniref:Protein kinase domain-containing protein n=1 Tax=Acorus calamus TaxID=4465 RepID=A0AAV9CDG8_ACOCL|nr:hypothetical protein QJS10_CPB20g00024 [Acorus calamus]